MVFYKSQRTIYLRVAYEYTKEGFGSLRSFASKHTRDGGVRIFLLISSCLCGGRVRVWIRNDVIARFDEGLMNRASSANVRSRQSIFYLSHSPLYLGQIVDNHRNILFWYLKGKRVRKRSSLPHFTQYLGGPNVPDYPVLAGFVELPGLGRG